MPQGLGRNLYPTLSVFENIDFHGRLFGQSEAERRRHIDELDDGKVIATGTTPQILQKTGEKTLEDAFIALLPEAERAQHHKVVMRPRLRDPDRKNRNANSQHRVKYRSRKRA
jgi:hypothetical protein